MKFYLDGEEVTWEEFREAQNTNFRGYTSYHQEYPVSQQILDDAHTAKELITLTLIVIAFVSFIIWLIQ